VKQGRLYAAVCGLALLPALGGCANVKPYEREMLADPIMSVNGGNAKENLMEKFYSTREGSMGGGTSVGGGCGCS
jgi:hypothetical protein